MKRIVGLLFFMLLGAATPLKTEKTVRLSPKKVERVDFEDTSILGEFQSPFASLLTSQETKFDSGFSSMRPNWHDVLLMSVMHLD